MDCFFWLTFETDFNIALTMCIVSLKVRKWLVYNSYNCSLPCVLMWGEGGSERVRAADIEYCVFMFGHATI